MKNLIFFCLFLFVAGCQTKIVKTTIAAPEIWPRASFASVGMDSTAIYKVDNKIKAGVYGYIDRMMLLKDGKLVFDRSYFQDYNVISKGKSGAMGCGYETCEDSAAISFQFNYYHPWQHPFYRGSRLHSLQSATKSVASTMIGIAIKNGAIKSVDEPVLNYLGDYDLSKIDERLKTATIKNLLCMQLGIEWHEHDRPFDMTNSTLQLEYSEDWVQFVLDQPMDYAPGEKWVYSSGGSHLMSAIIKKATGKTIDEYAREHLFEPLGIKAFHWKKTPKGLPDTEGGLYLRSEDLAKIGMLHLQGGMWEGQRILSKDWVREATRMHVKDHVPGPNGYGYQWWCFEHEGSPMYFALGFGGQLLLVWPDKNIVGVLNAWNAFEEKHDNLYRDFLEGLF